MLRKIGRLFVIKTRWEAYLIIYALALGAMTRGLHYTIEYPGVGSDRRRRFSGWRKDPRCDPL